MKASPNLPLTFAFILALGIGTVSSRSEEPRLDPFEERMGIWIQGRRVGWASNRLEPLSDTDPAYREGLRYRFREEMRLQGMATETTMEMKEDFSLGNLVFSFENEDPDRAALKCAARARGATLEVEVDSAGARSKQEMPLPEPCYPLSAAHLPVVQRGLQPGDRFAGLGFDPTLQSLSPITVEVGAYAEREALGRTWKAADVHLTYQGIVQTSWIVQGGLRLRDEAMNGLLVSKIEPLEATSATGEGSGIAMMFQMMEDFKVRAEGSIERPRQCRRLLLEVTGIAPEDVIQDSYWQRQAPGNDPAREAFRIEIGLQESQPGEADLKSFLEPSSLIQSDDPAIRKQALEIVPAESADEEKARRICQWVYRQVDRSAPRLTIPSAVETLKSRKGDCNEHAALVAALARAAEVPAKVCNGLMYLQGAFYYHAWNEVYLSQHGWVPLDATLDQFPADATHLKLSEGDSGEMASLLKAVGQIRLKVLENDGDR